jgi:hypothetical protein
MIISKNKGNTQKLLFPTFEVLCLYYVRMGAML